MTDTYTYDAFGNILTTTGSTPNNYKFAGEQFDPDLGLYYNRARYLDVRQGRFISADSFEGTLTKAVSLHRYLYASASPTINRDPSGFESLAELGASEDAGEILDSQSNPQQVIRAESQAKIADIYIAFGLGNFGGGGKLLGVIPIPHAYIFADLPGNQSQRFDVGLNEEAGATIEAALITTVPGVISVTPSTLSEVRADSIVVRKVASLSVLEYGI